MLVVVLNFITMCGALRRRSGARGAEVYTMELVSHGGAEYVAQVTVGGQNISAVMDSGSLDFVLISDICSDCGNTARLYHPEKSATHRSTGLMKDVKYGSGLMMTNLSYETLTVGPWIVEDVPFWEVHDADMPLLQETDWAAIFGLGPFPQDMQFTGRSENDATNIQWQLKLRSFSVCLTDHHFGTGKLIWNDNTRETVPDLFHEVRLNSDAPWWAANLKNFRLGDEDFHCGGGQKCTALIDSGTSLLAVPTALKSRMRDTLGEVACDDLASMPELHFNLGGVDVRLPPQSYLGTLFGEVGSPVSSINQGSSTCELLLMGLNMLDEHDGDYFILGLPFFRSYYTLFSQEPRQVHLAVSGGGCDVDKAGSSGETLFSESPVHMELDASRLRTTWIPRAVLQW